MSRVDVAVNIFAKPYQTSLALLSLLKFSGRHIDRVYLQFEPSGSMHDEALPYVIADYLAECPEVQAVVFQPEYWLSLDAAEPDRFLDDTYRLSIRYQYAFEHTDKDFLFVMHNDVLFKRDIIGFMLEHIGDSFATGQIGQCWNCPAAKKGLMQACGLGEHACAPDAYQHFMPDYEQLCRLYDQARQNGVFARPYRDHLAPHYSVGGWPLPECRVNEWAALVSMQKTRGLVVPDGVVLPFGAYEKCGEVCLDIAVPWFRELNRLGMRAKHMNISPYMTHWVGTGKVMEYKYRKAEGNARAILEKHFSGFAAWCRVRKNGMFT